MQYLRNLMSVIVPGATDSSRSPQSKNGELKKQSHQNERSCDYNHVVPEVQVTNEGEAGLGQAFDMCRKNPGHPNFIPVKDFCIEDLPEGYRDINIFDTIQNIQGLVCRLRVGYVSSDRPEHFYVSKIPYPCSKDKGKSSFHTGSGWVGNVTFCSAEAKGRRRTKGRKYIPEHCECIECLNSDSPCEEWVEIEVCTARNVTFDDTEVKETEVELFYDETDRNGVVKLQGLEMVVTGDIEDDNCWFVCHTHDMDLGQSLKEKKNESLRTLTLVPEMQGLGIVNKYPHLTVIVSHPHGCPKQISVGEWKEKQKAKGYNRWFHLTYDVCTCPGSSGACVWTPSISLLASDSLQTLPTHKGYCENGLGLSGLAYEFF